MPKTLPWLLLISTLTTTAVRADEADPQDFAYGLSVSIPADTTLAEITLPESVYRKIVFPDLRDLRVFNREGEPVRHSLSLPQATTRQEAYTPVFYPVHGKKNASGSVISIVATDGNQGVRAYLSDANPEESETAAYLVDLRELQKRGAQTAVTSVVLNWRGVDPGVALHVDVEASNDLQTWHTVRSGAVLGRFENSGQELIINHIDLPPTSAAYLKIFNPNDPKWSITSLQLWLEERTLYSWERRWEPALRNEAPEKDTGARYYAHDGAFRVDRLLVPLRDNRVLDLDVFSRSEGSAGWVRRGGGAVYRFRHAGRDVTSPPLKIDPTSDRLWKLQARGKDLVGALDGVTPQFGWVAHLLRFLPQGSGPFTIAYGNGSAKRPDFGGENLEVTVRRVLDTEDPIVNRAGILSTQLLGGEERRALPDTKQRSAALWTVLIVCVLFFGFIAWRLFREMQAGHTPPAN